MVTNVEEDASVKKTEPPLRPFTLEILKLIKESQQQHGLRHADYQRYRGYCSRRIRRLRKVLKVPQGDRRHFKRRDVTDAHLIQTRADERYLHIPLMLAERDWAYAMQLRQEANTEQRKKFHVIQKLRKASVYALQLDELCKSDRCDARTKLEAQAYSAWIQGTLQFELQLWQPAAENLTKSKIVYEKLSETLTEDDAVGYKQRCEEITPSLRYCAYNIGDNKQEVDLLELRSQGLLDTLILQNKEKEAEVQHEVDWHGIRVAVRPERVRHFLASIDGLDESLVRAEDVQARVQLLEQMFIDLRDAIAVAREEVRAATAQPAAQTLLSYLLAIRIERTVQRNQFLIEQTRKTQDVVRLYDINIQQIGDLQQLQPLQDKRALQERLQAKVTALRALRCFHMARAATAQKKWMETVCFYKQSINYCNKITKSLDKLDSDLKAQIAKLMEEVPVKEAIIQAEYVLEKEQQNVAPVKVYRTKKPLAERLDEFHEEPQLNTKNPNIVSLPPAMQPIPCKPLYYDLALNSVQFPNLQDKMDAGQAKQAASGISGLVKGFLGWGGAKK